MFPVAFAAREAVVPDAVVLDGRVVVPPPDGRVTLPPSLNDNVLPLNDRDCAGTVTEFPPEIDNDLPDTDRVC